MELPVCIPEPDKLEPKFCHARSCRKSSASTAAGFFLCTGRAWNSGSFAACGRRGE